MKNDKYIRQLGIPGWGEEGQKRLEASSVFIAGLGGLGSPVAMYLAAAGTGHLRICDMDRIQSSNLNRQILYSDNDIGKLKATIAAEKLLDMNSGIRCEALPYSISKGNIEELAGEAMVLVDCLDNYPSRQILNRFAVEHHLPLVHAGVQGISGQISFLHPPETPCLECIYGEMEDSGPNPIAGAIAGIMGSMQAMEVLKFITGCGNVLKNKMLIVDGESTTCHETTIIRNNNCPICAGS